MGRRDSTTITIAVRCAHEIQISDLTKGKSLGTSPPLKLWKIGDLESQECISPSIRLAGVCVVPCSLHFLGMCGVQESESRRSKVRHEFSCFPPFYCAASM